MTKRVPLHEMTQTLAAVAAGRQAADLVIRNGIWVNVYTNEQIPETMLAVVGGRIAYCGPDREELIGADTQVLDANNRYLVPGLLDAHVHIESSMMTVRGYANAVLPHGTTTAFIDPHEIANVLGLDGVRLMAEEAKTVPMQIYVQVPSCVPAAPAFETSGAAITARDVAEAMQWDNVIGLGEVMNYPGVAAGDPQLHEEIAVTLRERKAVGGHYASEDLGPAFHAYAASGPMDCHEGTRVEDAIARMRQGMYAILRQGSSEHNVATQVKAITEQGLDPRRALLCTDDRHPETLLRLGSIDDVVRVAIHEGVEPMTAIQMATLNTAERFGVSQDVGSIGPGRYADVLIVRDLHTLAIDTVIAAGVVVASEGKGQTSEAAFVFPDSAKRSLNFDRPLQESDFRISAPDDRDEVLCRVIGIVEHQVLTRALEERVPIKDGVLAPTAASGLAHLAVVERHSGSMRTGRALVKGYEMSCPFGLASTVAHDSHNLVVLGTDPTLMAAAGNRVAQLQGGICLVSDEGVLAEIPLPIAGLMSEDPVEVVAARADALHQALRDMGCTLEDALMPFFFLALPVIPQLRLTDLGLVDVERFEIVSLFVDN